MNKSFDDISRTVILYSQVVKSSSSIFNFLKVCCCFGVIYRGRRMVKCSLLLLLFVYLFCCFCLYTLFLFVCLFVCLHDIKPCNPSFPALTSAQPLEWFFALLAWYVLSLLDQIPSAQAPSQ